jgi:DNA-binding NarL/FixJ family response regulator
MGRLALSNKPLEGWRILLVEDEPIIALDVAQVLAEAGANVIGPAYSVSQALKLIESTEIDVAITDFRLERETAVPVAQRLIGIGVPFLFHTSVSDGVEQEVPKIPIVLKPSLPHQLVGAVAGLGKRMHQG